MPPYKKKSAAASAAAEKSAPVEKADPTLPALDGLTAAQRFLQSKLAKDLQKKFGDGSITTAADFRDLTHKLPTGIFPLDMWLGGGWPIGRILHVYGRKSSSKTTTILRSYSYAQRMCASCYRLFPEMPPMGAPPSTCPCGNYREPLCAYLDAEGAFDKKWAKTLGVDLDRLVFERPEFAEQGVDVVDAWVRSGEFDFITIDSIAFMVPLAEQEKEAGSPMMGTHARLIGNLVKKLVSGSIGVQKQQGRFPTIFLINQIREKIGVQWGSPDVTTGGNSPAFAASVEVLFKSAKIETDPTTGAPLWADIGFKIEKNKTIATAKAEGDFRMLLSDTALKRKGQIMDDAFVVSKAQELGIVTGAGSSWHCLGEHFSAKTLIEKRLLSDPEFSDKLRTETMKTVLATLA